MSKFDSIRQAGTDGINYDLTNEDIVAKLMAWDEAYGIDIAEVGHDRALVTFQTLPDDVMALAAEIYAFCPDVIDQGFGCMDDMVEMMAEANQPLEPETTQLIEGVDFADDDFGLKILERSLRTTRQVALWWD